MGSGRRPLQNRVTPFGDVVAIAQRGLFIGNRGIIHDPATKTLLGRRWTTLRLVTARRKQPALDPACTADIFKISRRPRSPIE